MTMSLILTKSGEPSSSSSACSPYTAARILPLIECCPTATTSIRPAPETA
jgi:hypothetical protein